MNLRNQLLKEHSKQNTQHLAIYIRDRKDKMAELMSLYSGKDQELARRAAWVLNHVHDLFPEQSDSYQSHIINTLKNPKAHDAVKRAGLRTLSEKYIHEENLGEAVDICFNLLNSFEEPVAIKVYAMEILKNIVKRVPDLKDELLFSLEEQMPFQSSGFKIGPLKYCSILRLYSHSILSKSFQSIN